ncbi:MAG: pilin [Candidatus Peregrinibacteria bacterium]|nr:pilin [Candidatus Peregrinibacteria bacterium]
MKKNILKILALILITLNLGATVVFAETQGAAQDFKQSVIPRPSTLPGPNGDNSTNDALRKTLVSNVLPKIAVILIGSIASLSLVFLIIAGVRFATAYGNDETVQKAKKQAIYAIVGLIISLMSYTIVTIVSNFKYNEFSPASTTNGPIHNETPGADLPQKDPNQ